MTSNVALHVTTGDPVTYLFKKAGVVGTYLAWRDALNEGPVVDGNLADASAVRTAFLAARGYGNPIKVIHDFAARDTLLTRAAEFREIVLWFEHDLYDQLQLLQILTALGELRLESGRVWLVQSDHYLGMMNVDELLRLFAKRRTATPATVASAKRAWQRFTSADPAALLIAAREDAIGLPFLRVALHRLCEEYPHVGDGLSRSQRHALEAVAEGPASGRDLFARAQAREEAAFLGETAFSRLLADLTAGALLEGAEGAYAITDLGRKVLDGGADWLESHPIDRWIGGVHLEADRVVRWDAATQRFSS